MVAEVVARLGLSWLAPSRYELLQRVYSARSAWTDMMRGDAYLGYTLKPGLDTLFPSEGRSISVRTTDHGLGDVGFRDIGTRAPFDMIAVGGSLTLCDDVPVEGCWLRKLSDVTGQSIATLGVNGYSTTAAARMLDRHGRRLRPRVVLAEVFPNDFKDDIVFAHWLTSGTDNYWTWAAAQRGRGLLSRWLAEHSTLYQAVDGVRRSWNRRIHSYRDEHFDFVFRLDGWWLRLVRNSSGDPGWPMVRESMQQFRKVSTEMDSSLVIVIAPSKEQVYWELVRRFAPGADELDPDRPTRAVLEYCRAEGIMVCDLTPAMRAAAANGEQLYHRISGHWNDNGGRVAGEEMARCLQQYGLAHVVPAR